VWDVSELAKKDLDRMTAEELTSEIQRLSEIVSGGNPTYREANRLWNAIYNRNRIAEVMPAAIKWVEEHGYTQPPT
jgi:hypothetical protein